ncbi:MAG: DUF5610 domain-containing protein [Marinobacterium sp.]|nr:DUF5610 domain-containing protein [Marinobacterium sp.]
MNVISSYSPMTQQSSPMRSDAQQRLSSNPEAEKVEDGQKSNHEQQAAKAKDTLLNRLAEHIPGVSPADMRSQKAEDFTPDNIAKDIAGFVGQGLDRARSEGRSEEDIQKMHAAAMRGIEKGFAEAKEILDGLNILKEGNIEQTIDETYDKTVDAVKALLPSENTSISAPRRSSEEFYAAERYSKAETFSLTLQTQEGDDVVIEFASGQYQQASVGGVNNANGSAYSASLERGNASSMSFSVKGDLNEAEMEAINNLLKDVNDIADEFFGGDIQAAFDKATEFEMDGSQLASMNLRLTRTETYSAASAYSSVGNMLPSAEQLAPLQDMGSKVGMLAEDPANAFMEEADKFISSILDSLVQQDIRYKDADDDSRAKLDKNLQQMQDMMAALFDRQQPTAVQAPAADAIIA